MGSRITVNGRVIWHRPDNAQDRAKPYPVNRLGQLMIDDRVDPDSPDAPFRAGTALNDPLRGIEFRVVTPGYLKPEQGWGSAEFWIRRWKCSYDFLVEMTRCHWLDAAMERGSDVRRFRCRNESRCLEAKRHQQQKDAGRRRADARWGPRSDKTKKAKTAL